MSDDEEEEGGDAWLVSYADLMTLLFAAFVVLYGTTPQGESNEILGIASSIRESFVDVPDEILEEQRLSHQYQQTFNFSEAIHEKVVPPNIKRFNRNQSELRGRNLKKDEVDIAKDAESRGEGVQISLRKEDIASDAEFDIKTKWILRLTFQPGTLRILPESKENLQQKSIMIKNSKLNLLIEGHASSEEADSRVDLIERSVLRASYVKELLARKYGIAKSRIHMTGYADLQPVSLKSAKDVDTNARVEISFLED